MATRKTEKSPKKKLPREEKIINPRRPSGVTPREQLEIQRSRTMAGAPKPVLSGERVISPGQAELEATEAAQQQQILRNLPGAVEGIEEARIAQETQQLSEIPQQSIEGEISQLQAPTDTLAPGEVDPFIQSGQAVPITAEDIFDVVTAPIGGVVGAGVSALGISLVTKQIAKQGLKQGAKKAVAKIVAKKSGLLKKGAQFLKTRAGAYVIGAGGTLAAISTAKLISGPANSLLGSPESEVSSIESTVGQFGESVSITVEAARSGSLSPGQATAKIDADLESLESYEQSMQELSNKIRFRISVQDRFALDQAMKEISNLRTEYESARREIETIAATPPTPEQQTQALANLILDGTITLEEINQQVQEGTFDINALL